MKIPGTPMNGTSLSLFFALNNLKLLAKNAIFNNAEHKTFTTNITRILSPTPRPKAINSPAEIF
jgi:hypothetical protein